MITMFALPLILAFAPAAVWAPRVSGLRRLWLLCALALPADLLAALVLSAVYSVPSTLRIVFYFLAFVGPSILFATGSLTTSRTFARTLPVQLTAAFAGSLIGPAVGFSMVFYVLGVTPAWQHSRIGERRSLPRSSVRHPGGETPAG